MTWLSFPNREFETCFWLRHQNGLFANNASNENTFAARKHAPDVALNGKWHDVMQIDNFTKILKKTKIFDLTND